MLYPTGIREAETRSQDSDRHRQATRRLSSGGKTRGYPVLHPGRDVHHQHHVPVQSGLIPGGVRTLSEEIHARRDPAQEAAKHHGHSDS